MLKSKFHPITFLEKYYQAKYHLRFRHAKKLFVIDILLLISIFLIGGLGFFWLVYVPSIVKSAPVKIRIEPDKFKSGDMVDPLISIENKSDKTFVDILFDIQLPEGFLLDLSRIPSNYTITNKNHLIGSLDNLPPKVKTWIDVYGKFYGEPEKEYQLNAKISFRQEKSKFTMESYGQTTLIPRGSFLESNFLLPEKMISQSSSTIKIILKNNGETGEEIAVKREINKCLKILPEKENYNEPAYAIFKDYLKIDLMPKEEKIMEAKLIANCEESMETEIKLKTEKIIFRESHIIFIPQAEQSKKISIVLPKIKFVSEWLGNQTIIRPEENKKIVFTINNQNNFDLLEPTISLPIITNSLVDFDKLIKLNSGKIQEGQFSISIGEKIQAKKTTEFILDIPLKKSPTGGSDLDFKVNSIFNAKIEGFDASYIKENISSGIKIISELKLIGSALYYSNDGQQLGRGPLPPEINKETKYWISLNIKNGSNRTEKCELVAELPKNIVWTGQSSVSDGNNLKFDETNNNVNWNISSILPYDNLGIYFLVSLTPSESDIDKTPILLKNAQITCLDDYTDEAISSQIGYLDISLPNDSIGRAKGTKVK